MRQNVKKAICMAAIGALTFVSVIGDNVTSEAAAKTKKIVMNKTKVSLKVGKTFKLKVKKVKPAKASKKVTYKSNKKTIATVSKNGVIKAKKPGTAKITVTSKKNKKAKATVTVTVKKSTTPNNNTVTPTAAPSNTPAAPSQVPSVSQPPVNTTAPTDVPSTSVPATQKPATQKPATQKPTTPPTPVTTPNIIDLDKYEFDVQESLWTNEWYDRQDNPDGSVTLTRGQGDADWKVGEFGIELPREKVGDQHKFKGIVIKYRDSSLTDSTVEKGVCGYVIHSVAQCQEIEASGREDKVGWYDFVDNPKENGHDAAIEFNGSGEVVITTDDGEGDFSTVRIYDGVIGGKITIESITVVKDLDTPGVDTPVVETPITDTSSGEKPGETGEPSTEPVMMDLSNASTYVSDGAGVTPSYDNAKGCLDVVLPQFQGIILKVPDDGKTYKSMKVTYTSDSKMSVYLLDGAMTDERVRRRQVSMK